jgi:hypothetical protein
MPATRSLLPKKARRMKHPAGKYLSCQAGGNTLPAHLPYRKSWPMSLKKAPDTPNAQVLTVDNVIKGVLSSKGTLGRCPTGPCRAEAEPRLPATDRHHTPAASANSTSANTTHTTPTSPATATRHSAMPTSMPVCRRTRATRAATPVRAMTARGGGAESALEAHPGQPRSRYDECQQGRQHEGGKQERPDRES